jgi:C1A family cysteine protease
MNITLDMRPALLAVRDQGYRPTCLAFAASDGHASHRDLEEWLSPEFLYHGAGALMGTWSYSDGLELEAVRKALLTLGQPVETNCPYQEVSPADVRAVDTSDFEPVYRCESCVGSLKAADLYEAALASRTFVVALNITRDFYDVDAPYIIDQTPTEIVGGHALLLAGLAISHKTGGRLFLLKNSWGKDWAQDGYVWITERYFNSHALGALEIQKAS